jgi:hypothetical protein
MDQPFARFNEAILVALIFNKLVLEPDHGPLGPRRSG